MLGYRLNGRILGPQNGRNGIYHGRSGLYSGPGQVDSIRAPIFSLPLSDSGAGAVNTTPSIAGGSGTPTFTRATTAWTKLSSGLWAQVASGTARSCYIGLDTSVGAYGGYLAEGARTNNGLWNRDLTNAVWVATTVTVAKDQTGIDGAANSASSVTASAGNGTLLQSVTLASQANVFQPFVKRITGTGEIDITLDGGATWTNITAQINSSTYTQVQATKIAANPQIGFRIVTNGDKIAVDMADMQGGAFATSPIPTTTVAATRNADSLTYSTSGNLIATVGACYAEITSSVANTTTGFELAILSRGAEPDGFAPAYIRNGAIPKLQLYDSVAERIFNSATLPATSIVKLATSWGGVTAQGFLSGSASSATAFSGDGILQPTMQIGNRNSSNPLFGTVSNLRIYGAGISAAQLQAMTA